MNKKFIALILVSLLTISQQLWAVSYRGFVEIGTGVVFPKESICNKTGINIPITTTHGLQILNQLFVGVGLGVDLGVNYSDYNFNGYYWRDYSLSACKKIRAYGDIRWDGFGLFGKGKRVSPFVDLKLGWQTNGSKLIKEREGAFQYFMYVNKCDQINVFSFNGFFLEPQVGIRIGCSSKVGINIGLYMDAVNFLKLGTKNLVIKKYDAQGNRDGEETLRINLGNLNLPSLGLMVGIDF